MVFSLSALEHAMYPYFFLDDNVMADYNLLHARVRVGAAKVRSATSTGKQAR
jgi:hypothetical protein